jgi:hypothetical protein
MLDTHRLGGAPRDYFIARIQSIRTWEWTAIAFSYLAIALVLRAVAFGNPVHIDEQFYLLVGDRMLHGALPYVDIWDRKPIGLFLLYAAMRLLGGDAMLVYQLVALLFVVATSITINRIARYIAPPSGALIAGAAYLPFLSVFGCFGGQSPFSTIYWWRWPDWSCARRLPRLTPGGCCLLACSPCCGWGWRFKSNTRLYLRAQPSAWC